MTTITCKKLQKNNRSSDSELCCVSDKVDSCNNDRKCPASNLPTKEEYLGLGLGLGELGGGGGSNAFKTKVRGIN